MLLDEILHEGRPIVDRDGSWSTLLADHGTVGRGRPRRARLVITARSRLSRSPLGTRSGRQRRRRAIYVEAPIRNARKRLSKPI